MIKRTEKATWFSIFAAGAIGVCFLLLLYRFVIEPGAWVLLPPLLGSILFPFPIALFAGFCLLARQADRSGGADEGEVIRPVPLVIALISAWVVTWGFGGLYKPVLQHWFADAYPLMVQSAVFSAAVLNFFFLRQPVVAAVLCGVSAAAATGVVFFI